MSAEPTAEPTRTVDLDITGMTCSSCAMRIEKKLNRLPGVDASVNYATERAHVECDPELDPAELVRVVEATGYSAQVQAPGGTGHHHGGPAGLAELRRRVLISSALAVPVVAMAMVPALQFTYWQWLSLTLAAPVVVWGAAPFHRAAWLNLRHGAATMDTLISMGTLAAFGWSVYALFWGGAGVPGMTMPFSFAVSRGSGADEIYLEVASAVTVFILAGRYAEARAKRRSGAALRALLELGAKEVSVLQTDPATGVRTEVRRPVERLSVGDRFVVRPGEKVATDGTVEEGTSAIDASLLTGESVPVEVGPGDAVTGSAAFTAAVAVLIIACPCALGLATPTALLVGTGRGAQLGILIKGPEILESTRRIDTVVLDKTGTVTTGEMRLVDVVTSPGQDLEQLLRRAVAVEDPSEHPIARAIAAGATERLGGVAPESVAARSSSGGAGSPEGCSSWPTRRSRPAPRRCSDCGTSAWTRCC